MLLQWNERAESLLTVVGTATLQLDALILDSWLFIFYKTGMLLILASVVELFAIKVSHLHLRALLWWVDFPWCTIPGKSRRKRRRRRRRREACYCEIDSIPLRWMLHLSPFRSLTALVPCFCYWIFRVNGDVSRAHLDGKWETDFHLETFLVLNHLHIRVCLWHRHF